jgi:hypothetical protein
MNKIIKEVLTNKEVRNTSALSLLLVTAVSAGQPWLG